MPLVTLATCNLAQWALDFDGNLERIKESIRRAKAAGATYRLGPELEITGYGCEDHFLEMDTFTHSWESLQSILASDLTCGIICDIGMPVLHNGVRYNCRVFCFNKRILLIRPKLYLADDGNYRESRWFTAWNDGRMDKLEAHSLPASIAAVCGQAECPFGVGVLQAADATIAAETCEELFTPRSPHIALGLDGVDIITNGSGSHHQLRKLHTRIELMRSATAKGGGVYCYANQQGCDGGRLYYDGCALIMINGELVAQGSQFSVHDVEVVVATVDLEASRSYRAAIASRGQQARSQPPFPRVPVDFTMCADPLRASPSPPLAAVLYHSPEEEIALGPACWLWDFLRRSGAAGYFLPLSGGADSASTATMVGIMCHLVYAAVTSTHGADAAAAAADREAVLRDLRKVVSDPAFMPTSPQHIASLLLHTCYMGTSNSGAATQRRAKAVAAELGAYHCTAQIDTMVAAVLAVFCAIFGADRKPRFESAGGTRAEDLALQNIQARLRMVLAYLLAQLLPWVRGRQGFLLVLGSANVDEALRGYMTKYDCSSADINPIGAIAKGDLKRFLLYASRAYSVPTLAEIVRAPPTAELRPITHASHSGSGSGGEEADAGEHSQTDEADMGMSYDDLALYGRLRKIERCGPLSMYTRLLSVWKGHKSPREVADKVKRFFFYYALNRHKMTTLTPAYHAESYSPDDNRYDLRPFLYRTDWSRAFAAIDADVALRTAALEADAGAGAGGAAASAASAAASGAASAGPAPAAASRV